MNREEPACLRVAAEIPGVVVVVVVVEVFGASPHLHATVSVSIALCPPRARPRGGKSAIRCVISLTTW